MSHPSLGSLSQGLVFVSTYQRQVVLSLVAGHNTVSLGADTRVTDGNSRRYLRLYILAPMIGITQTEAVMTIELQRPERRNALNSQLVDELREAVQKASRRGRPRRGADRPGHGVLRRRGPERRRLRRRLSRTGSSSCTRPWTRRRYRLSGPSTAPRSAPVCSWPCDVICGSSRRRRSFNFRRRNTVWLLITGASADCRRWWVMDAPAQCC